MKNDYQKLTLTEGINKIYIIGGEILHQCYMK